MNFNDRLKFVSYDCNNMNLFLIRKIIILNRPFLLIDVIRLKIFDNINLRIVSTDQLFSKFNANGIMERENS